MVIIGGGISGLAAAHRFQELEAEAGTAGASGVLLLEAGSTPGGLLTSEWRDGFLIEGGPDSFITDKPWALELCNRLGLAGQLIGTNDASRRSFIAHRGRLVPIPEGFQVLAPARLRPLLASPILSWRGKLRVLLEWFLPARRVEGDESLGAFVRRRFGAEALERLAEPLIRGIYGAPADQLSLAATLPRFGKMEQEHGSVIRALRRARAARSASGVSGARYALFMTLKDGTASLVEALAGRLEPESVRTGARVVRLSRGPSGEAAGGWVLNMHGGEQVSADAVCLAVPAYAASGIVRELDLELADLLGQIGYGSAATLNLAYRREQIPHPLNGFGFVVPAGENRSILGCTFASVKFAQRAPEGSALLRVFFGSEAEHRDDSELVEAARLDLRRYLGIEEQPLWSVLHRWPESMPRYAPGHPERVRRIEERLTRLPGVALAGNAYTGVGIPDSIRTAEAAAERLHQYLLSVRG